jgi:integrase
MTIQELSKHTIRAYGGWMVRFVWHYCRPLAEATEDDLLDFLESYPTRGSTRFQIVKTLSSFYDWAVESGLLQRNPAKRLRAKKPKYGPAPYLTVDELTRLVIAAAWKEPRRAWAILFIYGTGIRAGSAVEIMPEDIKDGNLHVRVAKGNRPYSVPLNRLAATAAMELLSLARKRHSATQTLIGVKYGALYQWLREAGRDAAFDGVAPHLLRHSFATRLAEHQVHARTLAELMNHQDLSQLTRYITVSDPSKRAAVEQLDEDF